MSPIMPKLGYAKYDDRIIEEALRRARYELIEDQEPYYYGEVPELKGVWATGKTFEECMENLKDVIEGWILVSLKRDMPVPRRGRRELRGLQAAVIHYARCDTRLALIILRRQVHPPGPNEADPTGTFISKIAMKKSHVGSLLSVQLFVRFSDKHHHDVQFLLPKW